MKPKINFLTRDGDGIACVSDFLTEGHEVLTCIDEKSSRNIYEGIIKKNNDIKSWMNGIKKNEIAMTDTVGYGEVGDALRARGVPVFGMQKFTDKLEDDRFFGLKFCEDCGIKVPLTARFTKIKDGIEYVKKNPERYVFKPSDKGKIQPSSLTYVSADSEDMLMFMQKQKDCEYILQVFTEGIEYSTEIYFSMGTPMTPSMHTIETKKAFPSGTDADGVGPATGCTSTVQIIHKDLENKLIKEGIGKCFDKLKEMKVTGSLDLNTIIDKQGNIWAIEWTARLGWSATYANWILLKEPCGMLVEYVAKGWGKKIEIDNKQFGMSVRVGILPFPMTPRKGEAVKVKTMTGQYVNIARDELFEAEVRQTENIPVSIVPHDNIKYNFLDVRASKDGKSLVCAGCDGIILEVGTKNKSIEKGRMEIFQAIDDITLQDFWYRGDSCGRALQMIPDLIKAGIYDGPEFSKEDIKAGEKYYGNR